MDTNKLRELLGAAKPGPWVAQDTEYSVVICDQDGGSLATVWPESLLGKKHEKAANAALIVALRNNAESLLARLEAAEAVVEAAREFALVDDRAAEQDLRQALAAYDQAKE